MALQVDFLGELTSGVIGLGLGYAVNYGARKTNELRQNSLIRHTWDFLREPTHLFLPFVDAKDQGAAGGYGDLLAMSHVIAIANSLFPPGSSLVVHTQQGDLDSVRSENLVVLGGGKYNAVYREFVERLGVPLHFFDTATESFREIRNAERSITFCPEYDDQSRLTNDIALLVRARNPFNDAKKVVLAAGSHTYGSAAAVEFLMNRTTLREVSPHLNSNFEVIIGADIRNHSITGIRQLSRVMTWIPQRI